MHIVKKVVKQQLLPSATDLPPTLSPKPKAHKQGCR